MEAKISARQYNYLKGLEKEGKIKLDKNILDISTEAADSLIKSANGNGKQTQDNPIEVSLEKIATELKEIKEILKTRIKWLVNVIGVPFVVFLDVIIVVIVKMNLKRAKELLEEKGYD